MPLWQKLIGFVSRFTILGSFIYDTFIWVNRTTCRKDTHSRIVWVLANFLVHLRVQYQCLCVQVIGFVCPPAVLLYSFSFVLFRRSMLLVEFLLFYLLHFFLSLASVDLSITLWGLVQLSKLGNTNNSE